MRSTFRARPYFGLAIAVVLAVAALWIPASASAQPVAAAKYNGTVNGGGTVYLRVSTDGTGVAYFSASSVPGLNGSNPCTVYASAFYLMSNFPIVNNSFSATVEGFSFAGTFPAFQQAQGTLSISHDGCVTGQHDWTASTTDLPPATTPPVKPPTTTPDLVAPALALKYQKAQSAVRRRRIDVQVQCPGEACTATAQGSIAALKAYRLTPVTIRVAAGGRATLHLKLGRKALSGVKAALRKHVKVKAFVVVTARDAAGNATTRNCTIRIR